ncbi:MAG: enoyl-CoA hydratase-related protein [Rhodospirillales bacterium]
MVEAPFVISHEGAVAHLRFCRPHAANSMTPAFWELFPVAVRDLDAAAATRALVISGEGRHFCSGMDVAAFGSSELRPDEGPARREAFVHTVVRLQAALSSLSRARFPVVAAIQGACIGGGLDLASACDLRFVAEDAYFRIEEINIGMMADVGSLQRLPRLLPDAVLREMAFCGRTLRAAQAAALGFVNAVVADPVAAALEAAREIAARAPLAVAASKRAIEFARDHTVAESLEQAAWLQAAVWSTPDVREAMRARGARDVGDFGGLREVR